jgi:hypothetical protein
MAYKISGKVISNKRNLGTYVIVVCNSETLIKPEDDQGMDRYIHFVNTAP